MVASNHWFIVQCPESATHDESQKKTLADLHS
jgi:hypothetical protein